MDRLQSFASQTPFKPAFSYLSSQKSRSSNEDIDSSQFLAVEDSPPRQRYRDRSPSHSSQQSESRPVSLISVSRNSSPLPRQRSSHHSEDEDEVDCTGAAESDELQSRPLVSRRQRRKAGGISLLRKGGLGKFLLKTNAGQRIYVGLLCFWVMGTQFALLLINRFILWTGTYKFPYPLTLTLIELLVAHVMILGFVKFTHIAKPLMHAVGFDMAVAPTEPHQQLRGPQGYRQAQPRLGFWTKLKRIIAPGSGGIAGGGLLEFEWKTAKRVLPLAVLFLGKVVLSNISYAYAVLPVYESARISIVPFTLLLTFLLNRTSHSVQTLSSTLIATINLFVANFQPGNRAPWQGIVAGVFSTLFVALYPIQLQRTYRTLIADLAPQNADLIDSESDSDAPTASQRKRTGVGQEETRAYYRILHYTSVLTIALLTAIAAVSGEWRQIRRNCYFLDVPWFWFLVWCASLGCFCVFTTTLMLVNATSPLSANFVTVPRRCFEVAMLAKLKMPAHSWVAVCLCWASCIWYTLTRVREGRVRDVVAVERGG